MTSWSPSTGGLLQRARWRLKIPTAAMARNNLQESYIQTAGLTSPKQQGSPTKMLLWIEADTRCWSIVASFYPPYFRGITVATGIKRLSLMSNPATRILPFSSWNQSWYKSWYLGVVVTETNFPHSKGMESKAGSFSAPSCTAFWFGTSDIRVQEIIGNKKATASKQITFL